MGGGGRRGRAVKFVGAAVNQSASERTPPRAPPPRPPVRPSAHPPVLALAASSPARLPARPPRPRIACSPGRPPARPPPRPRIACSRSPPFPFRPSPPIRPSPSVTHGRLAPPSPLPPPHPLCVKFAGTPRILCLLSFRRRSPHTVAARPPTPVHVCRALIEASLAQRQHAEGAQEPRPECFVPRRQRSTTEPATSQRPVAVEPARVEGAAPVPVRQARVEGWTLNPEWRPVR